MKSISNRHFEGERPLFGIHDTILDNITIAEGESGIKCCNDIICKNSHFFGKYPLWHVDRSTIEDCHFHHGSRSAIWYSNDMVMRRCRIDDPKFFREMSNLTIEDVVINDADETFWKIKGLNARNIELHGGTYPFIFSDDIYIDGLVSDSKYVFQYCHNVELHNARITTKDSFWECSDVTIYDSVLDGEYLAWHSSGITLVRCHISGEQPLCYMKGVTLIDCTFDSACDRAFEDSTDINADIKGHITDIKNPISGHIVADSIGSVTIDEYVRQPADCKITIRE